MSTEHGEKPSTADSGASSAPAPSLPKHHDAEKAGSYENGADGAKTWVDEERLDLVLAAAAERHGYHQQSGRFVLDPEEAAREFGPELAKKLKLSPDGRTVLWPQPTDSPRDPQNWSNRKKYLHLLIASMAAFVPDFSSGCGIASLFQLAAQFKTTTGEINNLTSNWSIFLLGWGGIAAVIIVKRWGRLPVMFWSQVFGLAFMIGCTFSKDLKTFAAMRCLQAWFSTAPQVTGLYTINDIFPVHLAPWAINMWGLAFIVSPFISPFLGGYIAARASWRWVYAFGSFYGLLVVIMITLFMEETMYDRKFNPVPEITSPTGLTRRIEDLTGVTGLKMRKYRTTWAQAWGDMAKLGWRPQMILPSIFLFASFGFGIGINVTNVVFVGSPPPLGRAWSQIGIASGYATPIVGAAIGEFVGRRTTDLFAKWHVKRNHGVLHSEAYLWNLYYGVPIYVLGFCIFGASLQKDWSDAGIVFGWGMCEFGIMVCTMTIYAYCNATFPAYQGEISAWLQLFRTLGGFAIPYFQVDWATEHGPLQTFGCEAAITAGLFILIIPMLQHFGPALRNRFAVE